MACAMVEAEAGVAFVDELAVQGSVSNSVTARPVVPRQSIPVSVLSVRGQPISTTAKLFVELLRAELKAIGDARRHQVRGSWPCGGGDSGHVHRAWLAVGPTLTIRIPPSPFFAAP